MRSKNGSNSRYTHVTGRHKCSHTEYIKDDGKLFRIRILQIGLVLVLLLFILFMFFLGSQSPEEGLGEMFGVLLISRILPHVSCQWV